MNPLLLEKKASDFRNKCGYSNFESIRLKSLLQKLNVLSVFQPLQTNFSGMAIKVLESNEIKRFMLINSELPLGKQHFTICHELYHLFIQENFEFMVCNTGKYDKQLDPEEKNADIFASYFLIPKEGLLDLIPDKEIGLNKISLKTILKIEQYFSCSRAALLYRLKKLGIINSSGYDQFLNNVKRSAIQYGYNISLYEKGNNNLVLSDYGSLARELFDDEIISESHYYSLLLDIGIDIQSLEGNAGDDKDFG